MPCWEVNLMSVEFNAKNIVLLEQALKDVGMSYRIEGELIVTDWGRIDLARCSVTCDARDFYKVNELKRAYSVRAVNMAARRNRWAVKRLAQNKMQLRRF